MPAGIGRKYVGDMFAAIGGLTRQGRAAALSTRAAADTVPGMVTPRALSEAIRIGHIKAGKRATGYGMMGASAISMMSTNRSTGAYRPAPVNPISSPQGSGRYA